MATLTIDPIPEPLLEALRRLAAEHRRSPEAEARNILENALPGVLADAASKLEEIRKARRPLEGRVTPLSDEILEESRRERHL